MSEQANSVSNALSLPLNAARSGRVELTASGNNAFGKNSAFSNDFDQARQVQLDNTRAPVEQRETRKEGNQVSLTGLMNRQQTATSDQASQSGESALSSDARADVSGSHNVVDEPITREIDESSNPLLSAIPEPQTGEVIKSVSLTDSLETTKTLPNSKGDDPIASTVSDQRHGRGSAESTPVNPLAVPQQSPVAPGDPVTRDVTQATLTGRSEQSITSLNVVRTAAPSVTDLQFTPKVQSVEETQNAIKGHLPKEQTMDAALRKPALGSDATLVHTAATAKEQVQRSGEAASTAEPTTVGGLVKTPVLSELEGPRFVSGRLSKEPPSDAVAGKLLIEPVTAPAQAATAAKATVYRSEPVTISPEPLVSGQPGKTSTPVSDAVALTQPAPDNTIVTQTMLAGRLQRLHSDMAAAGSATPVLADKRGSTQPVVASPSVENAGGLVAGATPVSLVNDSMVGTESLSVLTEIDATVHQRIAATEVILSQMAQEAGSAVSRVPTAETTLLPAVGGIVSAVMSQHSEPVTGSIAQAPLTLDLASADAETTLAGNVKWMTNEGVKNAVLTVTPHGMGSISVKIGIVGDQMDVSIIASQHTTRDALESMLPRLREQLAVQGHESVKVDVSDGKSEQSRSGNGQTFSDSRNPAGATPQDNQSNSSKQGEKTEHGGSDKLEVVSESVMAEDLQRVAARVVGEAGSHPVFDAYV